MSSRRGIVLKIVNVSYTGRSPKVCGTLLQMLLKTNRFNDYSERLDARAARQAYGSCNSTVLTPVRLR